MNSRRRTQLPGLLKRFDSERGQAAFEFVLVLPFFLLFLLLLVDLGIMMYEYVSISNAAREGARFGAVNCGDGRCDDVTYLAETMNEVEKRAIERSGGIISANNVVEVGWVNVDGTGTNHDRGDAVVVKIRHPYDFLFFPGVTMDVYSCADMRLEQQDLRSSLPTGSVC